MVMEFNLNLLQTWQKDFIAMYWSDTFKKPRSILRSICTTQLQLLTDKANLSSIQERPIYTSLMSYGLNREKDLRRLTWLTLKTSSLNVVWGFVWISIRKILRQESTSSLSFWRRKLVKWFYFLRIGLILIHRIKMDPSRHTTIG